MTPPGADGKIDGKTAAHVLAAAREAAAQGDQAGAVEILATFDRNRDDAEVSFTLGVWRMNAGDANTALVDFQRAARLAPQVPEVFINMAAAASRLGQHDEAVESARHAVMLTPDRAVAHGALGNALVAANRLKEGEVALREAAERAPDTLAWKLNLGDCLLAQGLIDTARRWFNHARQQDPTNSMAFNGLGLCEQAAANHTAAIPHFEKAVAQQAQYAEAFGNMAISLQCLGRHEDALEAARQAVEIAPSDLNARLNLGHILQSLGRHAEAVDAYQDALSRDPALPGAHAYLLHSRRHICAWDDDAQLVAAVIDDVHAGAQVPPFALAGTTADAETRLIAARRSAAAAEVGPVGDAPAAVPGKPTLRVGFVSPDFRTHSLAMSFSSVLAARQDSTIQWIGYSVAAGETDTQTEELAEAFDRLVDLNALSADQAAARIRADGIDVLVDLAGHTRGGRLDIFARRPAPVQAHYLGYGSTVGADYIPWLVTDRTHTPPALAAHCTEVLAYLPDTFMAARRIDVPEVAPTRAEEGLPATGVVYASFNATYKLDPAAFGAWMNILSAVPDSVLWLRAAGDDVQDRLRDAAAGQGVDGGRLVFAARKDRHAHLARHQLADICLDAFGHTGGVTTLDALLAGVPVLTIAGTTQSARTGASILTALGTPAWIHDDVAGYTAAAIALGTEPEALRRAKETLRRQRDAAPLFDAGVLAAHLNTAFRKMYDMAAHGTPPTTFDVDSKIS